MFNSVVLDVFIGLVLLYLLYSLLISIVGEMIAAWLGLRSRYLRKAIETMLNDEHIAAKRRETIIRQVRSFFLYEEKEFRNSFAGKFYAHPSISYLAPGRKTLWFSFKKGKPAYINRENFSATIIQMLRNRGIGADDMEKVSFCLKFNTMHIQAQTLAHLRNLLNDSDNEIKLFSEKLIQWYSETMDRANGWYKGKLQFILFWLGFLLAMTFNVDSFQIAKQLTADKEARKQLVEIGIQASDENSAIGKAIRISSDSTIADSLLRKSYTEVKTATDNASKVLGSGWNLNARVKSGRIRITMYPVTFNGLQKQFILPAKNLEQSMRKYQQLANHATSRSQRKSFITILQLKTDSLAFLIRRFNRITSSHFTLDESIKPEVIRNNQNTMLVRYSGKKHYSILSKAVFIIHQSMPWHLCFWGFVITALMISLGAPFWFDLLRKLVSIRSAGVKPEEKTGTTADTSTSSAISSASLTPGEVLDRMKAAPVVSTSADNFIAAAIKKYSPEIKMIPGVKSVFRGLLLREGQWIDCVQVNVHDSDTETAVKEKFSDLNIENIPVAVNIVIAGSPKTHEGFRGRISNKSGNNSFGSLGCVLKNKGSGNLHILSCWHVMKGDLDYDHDDQLVSIVDNGSPEKIIGNRWGGGIQGCLDYGIARCLQNADLERNKWLKEKLNFPSIKFKPVTSADISSQINICFYDIFSDTKVVGKIYTATESVEIRYVDKIREIEDLLILTNDSFSGAISKPGNSGSIVFDESGNAIGMIIAGDLLYTYAIKLSNFFNLLDEMIPDS